MNHLPVIILGAIVLVSLVLSIFQIRNLLRRAKDMPNRHGK